MGRSELSYLRCYLLRVPSAVGWDVMKSATVGHLDARHVHHLGLNAALGGGGVSKAVNQRLALSLPVLLLCGGHAAVGARPAAPLWRWLYRQIAVDGRKREKIVDSQTLRYYESHAEKAARRCEGAEAGIASLFPFAFQRGERVLKVGAGSGRDAARLLHQDVDIQAVEPSSRADFRLPPTSSFREDCLTAYS